jgi:NAD(P)-dependent dehydrogenase (short-subunit alcohol dehydrogenase family)
VNERPSPFLLTDAAAVVVGTSANIGTGIALELARAGAKVACVDRDPQTAAHARDEVLAAGAEAIAVPCDVTDEDQVAAAVEQAVEAFGVISVLVNGPVQYVHLGVLEMSLKSWRSQLAVLLDGPFLFTKYIASRLVASGCPGSIINLVSTAGHQGEPGNIGYTTAKGGILNMTRSAAVELAPFGIRVNSITPTSTAPEESLERSARWGVPGVPEDFLTALADAAGQVPLGELPSPSDYGRAAVYLASPAARMITGIDLRVDAGSIAKYWRSKPT